MRIKIKIHPNSSQEKIEKRGEDYEVWLKTKPIENKANVELVKLLQKYFKQKVKIVSGFRSKYKVVELLK